MSALFVVPEQAGPFPMNDFLAALSATLKRVSSAWLLVSGWGCVHLQRQPNTFLFPRFQFQNPAGEMLLF